MISSKYRNTLLPYFNYNNNNNNNKIKNKYIARQKVQNAHFCFKVR